jgi:Protein of unknown function (DUF3800)
MLVFIDESWQTINGVKVAALGAVAIRASAYNKLSTAFFAMKQRLLEAEELSDKEIKGNINLAPAPFRRRAEQGSSHRLDAVDETFAILKSFRASAFAVWTTEEDHLPLRNKASTTLAAPYEEMLHDLRRMMRGVSASGGRKAMLFFDQRGHSEDLAMACAVQNYIMRTHYSWRKHFLQVPHFTRSAVSPGLQAADLVAYLAGRQVDPTSRPELTPYWEKVSRLGYVHPGARPRSALRLVA